MVLSVGMPWNLLGKVVDLPGGYPRETSGLAGWFLGESSGLAGWFLGGKSMTMAVRSWPHTAKS